ncbi:MAG: hypothetical protein KME21_11395 [Desmonostoc vinosum HA7617-LM4]|jgi:tetratricopeptide (TPR) repeat protein|nr:hypothetical protein [Desmonostoc vinosum HA7617-LM4]
MQIDWNDQFLAQRGETFRLSGAYEQAINIFNEFLQKDADNAWIHAHIGTTYRQLMDYEQAEDHLKQATAQNDEYLWAHAQLGETYRLLAIVNNRQKEYIELAIKHFKKAFDSHKPENSNYAWALAHLGATYRLSMVCFQQESLCIQIDQNIKQDALNCLNRAIELIPTYAWAWGMRATVYRLAQEYENSFWDLGVETLIAPNSEILQGSSSPVSSLESRRVNLHEHAFLSFYLTKNEADKEGKRKHYERAIAYALQALIINPNDLIAKLIVIVVKANQKKEEQDGSLLEINDIKEEVEEFLQDARRDFSEACQKVLLCLVKAERIKIEDLQKIKNNAGEKHPLTQLVLEDVINNTSSDVEEDPKLWIQKNFALTETCSSVLTLFGNLSHILNGDPLLGKAQPYRDLAATINPIYALERIYQTPVLSESERSQIFNLLSDLIIL